MYELNNNLRPFGRVVGGRKSQEEDCYKGGVAGRNKKKVERGQRKRMQKEGGDPWVPLTYPTTFEDQYKGQRSISSLILQCYNSNPPPPNQTKGRQQEEDREEELNECKRKYEEVLEERRGPRVPRNKGSKVQRSEGPLYLVFTFKYELHYKEGQSCIQN